MSTFVTSEFAQVDVYWLFPTLVSRILKDSFWVRLRPSSIRSQRPTQIIKSLDFDNEPRIALLLLLRLCVRSFFTFVGILIFFALPSIFKILKVTGRELDVVLRAHHVTQRAASGDHSHHI